MHERTNIVSIRFNTVSCPTPKIGGVMVSFMVSEVVFCTRFMTSSTEISKNPHIISKDNRKDGIGRVRQSAL